MRPLVIALVCVALAGAALALLDWTWTRSAEINFGAVCLQTGALGEHDREGVEARTGASRQRRDAIDRIGAELCAGELTLTDATDAAAAIVAGDPKWREQLRCTYERIAWAPPGASDRELGACYLRAQLDMMRAGAERRGDTARRVVVDDCIANLNEAPAVRFDALTPDVARDIASHEVMIEFTSNCPPHTWLKNGTLHTICGPYSVDGQERTVVLRGDRVGKLRDGKRVRVIGAIRVIHHHAAQVNGVAVPEWDEIRFEER